LGWTAMSIIAVDNIAASGEGTLGADFQAVNA
jgi:hypothetical protein